MGLVQQVMAGVQNSVAIPASRNQVQAGLIFCQPSAIQMSS